jgi:hypothetical protein
MGSSYSKTTCTEREERVVERLAYRGYESPLSFHFIVRLAPIYLQLEHHDMKLLLSNNQKKTGRQNRAADKRMQSVLIYIANSL